MGQVLDVFLVQVGGGFIQGKDACRWAEDFGQGKSDDNW
jgi:predicted NUDIX family NTP pyrophosphohydrolase